MLNYLWSAMMLTGILWGAFSGSLSAVTNEALAAAAEAVQLCITMLGILAFWSGILEIGHRAGLIKRLSRKMRPLLKFLFPALPADHPALEAISANIAANLLGLGWAATPPGLKAMEQLEAFSEEQRQKNPLFPIKKGTASEEMCTFLVVNISSLQLIPVTMIAYRTQYASANPTAVVGPALLATAVSTLAGIFFCKIMQHRTSGR